MEEPSVCVPPDAELRIPTADSPAMLRSTMSTPKSPSESSDDCEGPECKCAICLGRLRNKSLIDSCFHEFCFECLVEWSKVKAECPLCKTKFAYIIHNVKSNDDYEKYHCQTNQRDGALQIPWIDDPNQNFRYRTTMEPSYQERLTIQEIMVAREQSTPNFDITRTRMYLRNSRAYTEFRYRAYRENLWVQPLSDVTNRFRESSPSFYRDNPAQVYRLVRWLQRELLVVLPPNCPHKSYVMQTLINHVFQHPIRSAFFSSHLRPYLGSNTRHFIHEFAEFARSPFDMGGYDRSATYLPRGPPTIQEVVLNSPTNSDYSDENLDDRLNSSGSDVEIIENGIILPPAPVAGPSGVMRSHIPRIKTNKRSNPILPLSNEETHEIISSSSSDDCEVIGTFKPPTPEVIDILSDDNETQSPLDQSALITHIMEQRTPRAVGERLVSCHDEETTTPRSDRTPDVTSPSYLEASTDRPRLIVKIESSRLKRKAKKRRRHRELSDKSSSESPERVVRPVSPRKEEWFLIDSDSDYDPGGEKRIPSVVVPQPSFMAEAGSSRLGGEENDNDGGSVTKRDVRDHREKCRKRKKTKHSRKHKRSHRVTEDEERGEGTSGSGSSRRCKTCRHKHCRCNQGASSRCFKRVKNHRRETTTEERESASGSSRTRSKSKRHSKFKYSDSRCSDSSG